MFKNEAMADLLVLYNWMENELFILHSFDATSKNSDKSGLFFLNRGTFQSVTQAYSEKENLSSASKSRSFALSIGRAQVQHLLGEPGFSFSSMPASMTEKYT